MGAGHIQVTCWLSLGVVCVVHAIEASHAWRGSSLFGCLAVTCYASVEVRWGRAATTKRHRGRREIRPQRGGSFRLHRSLLAHQLTSLWGVGRGPVPPGLGLHSGLSLGLALFSDVTRGSSLQGLSCTGRGSDRLVVLPHFSTELSQGRGLVVGAFDFAVVVQQPLSVLHGVLLLGDWGSLGAAH